MPQINYPSYPEYSSEDVQDDDEILADPPESEIIEKIDELTCALQTMQDALSESSTKANRQFMISTIISVLALAAAVIAAVAAVIPLLF